jgi:hypothetical protein
MSSMIWKNVEFRKAPLEKSTRHLMPEDCRIRWNLVGCNHVFQTAWFQRERCEALESVTIMGHVFSSMVKSVAENGMKAEI